MSSEYFGSRREHIHMQHLPAPLLEDVISGIFKVGYVVGGIATI
jgi:hypothetical protein